MPALYLQGGLVGGVSTTSIGLYLQLQRRDVYTSAGFDFEGNCFSDGVLRLGLGLKTSLETRFLKSRSRSRRSQVSSRSRSRRISVLVSNSSSRDFA